MSIQIPVFRAVKSKLVSRWSVRSKFVVGFTASPFLCKKKNSYYLKNKTIICHLNCSNDHTSITIKLSPTTSNIQTSFISNLLQWKEKKKPAPPTCTFLPSLTLLHCYTFAFLSDKIMDFCNWEIKYGAVEADFIREESSVLSTPSWMNPNC